ncbi:MAG TPA: 4a-hydroxytetrahydrobiopterin dehydratase [Bacteroidetes bacterium]|nr:4a-hydroxytetrahydrobiopterin dehydratase [Bacteroidota bacterium]
MWTEKDNSLQAVFQFKNFTEAFAFMTEVAFLAEKHNHHPDWSNVWNTVRFKLNTHDAGGVVTEKDHRLAAAIDEVAKKYFNK